MPYAPGISYDTTSLANGINNAGQNLAQAFKEFQINTVKAKEADGIITGAIQANPELIKGADDKTLKLLEKFKNGDTGLKDKIFLAGWATMTQKGYEKKQEMEARQLQMQALQRQAQQQAAAQQFAQMAQQTQGGATGPLNNQAMRRFTSPEAQDAASVYRSTGAPISEQGMIEMQRIRAAGGSKPQPIVFASEKELNAKYPSDKFDYNFTPTPDGRVVIPDGKISPRAPVAGQMEPGFEPDPVNGGVRPIKGSSADMKKKDAEAADAAKLAMHINRADVILNTIKDVLPQVGALTSGLVGGLSKAVPGTPAYDVAKRIDTIKANIGIEQLQAMRDASKTGSSGFGQLAVKELDALQSSMGNLELAQSKGQLLKALSDVQNHYERWKKAVSGENPDAASELEAIKDKYRKK
tara:strand:- start:1774 stop:3006 length:1233 start_codon:yes stop_codon:yes gene_type:complete